MGTLGALFAGSAVMFAAAVLNGGSLLTAGDEAGSIIEPLASPTGTGPSSSGSITAPGQHTPGLPGGALQGDSSQWGSSQWNSSPGDLPVWWAPVQEAPSQGAPAPATPAEIAYQGSAASGSSVERTTAPGQPTDDDGVGRPSSPTADSRHGGPFDGLLNSVFHVAKGIFQ